MDESPDGAIRLDFASRRPSVTSLAEINETLHPIGFGAWPLDVGAAPAEIRDLLSRPTLTGADVAAVEEHFLLPRARLVEIIEGAGRKPQVAEGGEMSTFDATNVQAIGPLVGRSPTSTTPALPDPRRRPTGPGRSAVATGCRTRVA